MKFSNTFVVGGVFAGIAAATIAAPVASAAPDCSGPGVANTVSSVTGSARDYLRAHPGAGQVVYAAQNQPRDEAAANIRSYFTANPTEYYELRGIIAPIGLGYFAYSEIRARRREAAAETARSPEAPVTVEDKLADRYGRRR